MIVEDPPPSVVAAFGKLFGGGDDVGEQHGRQLTIGCDIDLRLGEESLDLGKHRSGVAEEDVVLGPGELDEPAAAGIIAAAARLASMSQTRLSRRWSTSAGCCTPGKNGS